MKRDLLDVVHLPVASRHDGCLVREGVMGATFGVYGHCTVRKPPTMNQWRPSRASDITWQQAEAKHPECLVAWDQLCLRFMGKWEIRTMYESAGLCLVIGVAALESAEWAFFSYEPISQEWLESPRRSRSPRSSASGSTPNFEEP
jgi:hypothetical protein